METLHPGTQQDNEIYQKSLIHHPGISKWRIFKTLLILTIISAGCIPNQPIPSTPGGPPSTAKGQAILSWGKNSSGQLGDGTTQQKLTPSLVALRNIQTIAAGGDFSMALTTDGRVFEWGGGKMTPTEVGGLAQVKQIAAGDRHRLALRQDGTVWTWGDNNRGQLGDGTNSTHSTPVQITTLSNVVSIAGGGEHSLAIKNDLSVWAWGANDKGQLGDGSTNDRSTPAQVPGVLAIEVDASSNHSIALTTDLKVMGWGSNLECQLGVDPRNDPFDPIVCSNHLLPSLILGRTSSPFPSSTGHAIGATDTTTLVVFSNGSVYGFGGVGDPIQSQFRGMCNPDLVLGEAQIYLQSGVKEVTAGTDFALFLTSSGGVESLGANVSGQLGTGSTSAQECPQVVPSTSIRSVSQLAAGKEHSLALVQGALSLSPTTLDLGNQKIRKTSAGMNVTVTNTGPAPVSIYNITVSPTGDFAFSENCPDSSGVLAVGASCTITVTFTPTATGQRNAKIQIIDDGVGSPREISLTGNGT